MEFLKNDRYSFLKKISHEQFNFFNKLYANQHRDRAPWKIAVANVLPGLITRPSVGRIGCADTLAPLFKIARDHWPRSRKYVRIIVFP